MASEPVIVVGAGASAVHFALTLLQQGRAVRMFDVGRTVEDPPAPGVDVEQLRSVLPDPVSYFLGPHFEGLAYPRHGSGYNGPNPWLARNARQTDAPDGVRARHGFPPQLEHVFRSLPQFTMRTDRFSPFVSFAQGGLAEAWTAGAFPWTDDELSAFPFEPEALSRHYGEVARRIGISGSADDMAGHMPSHGYMQPPLPMASHSQHLWQRYEDNREHINEQLGCVVGRSRSAVLSEPLADRTPCTQLGRCSRGCPQRAIYSPVHTLRECLAFEDFEYVPNVYARHFRYDRSGAIGALVVDRLDTGSTEEVPVGTLALAAGTLSSSRIVLESIYRSTGKIERLPGLMDTRMVVLPFITPDRVCSRPEPNSFQYHQLCFALQVPGIERAVHGQLSTPGSASTHAVAQAFRINLKSSAFLLRHLQGGMGMATFALPDTRRDGCYLTLEPEGVAGRMRLVASYRSVAQESEWIRDAASRIRRVLRSMGSICPPGMLHVRPAGAGIHYAGTLPMTADGGTWTVTPDCRSRAFENLLVVDGSTFPELPAKGLTMTLMANAIRVARTAV